jgi:hypothetical protein
MGQGILWFNDKIVKELEGGQVFAFDLKSVPLKWIINYPFTA